MCGAVFEQCQCNIQSHIHWRSWNIDKAFSTIPFLLCLVGGLAFCFHSGELCVNVGGSICHAVFCHSACLSLSPPVCLSVCVLCSCTQNAHLANTSTCRQTRNHVLNHSHDELHENSRPPYLAFGSRRRSHCRYREESRICRLNSAQRLVDWRIPAPNLVLPVRQSHLHG